MSPIYHCNVFNRYGVMLRDPIKRLKVLSREEVVALTLQGSHFIKEDPQGSGCTAANCGSICRRMWEEAAARGQ